MDRHPDRGVIVVGEPSVATRAPVRELDLHSGFAADLEHRAGAQQGLAGLVRPPGVSASRTA